MKEESKSELTLAQRFVTMADFLGGDPELFEYACAEFFPHVINVDWEPNNGPSHVVVFDDESGAMFADGEIKAGFMQRLQKASTLAEQFEQALSTTDVGTPGRTKVVDDMWDGVIKTVCSGNDFMLIFKDLSCILCSKESGNHMKSVTYTKDEMLEQIIGTTKEILGM